MCSVGVVNCIIELPCLVEVAVLLQIAGLAIAGPESAFQALPVYICPFIGK